MSQKESLLNLVGELEHIVATQTQLINALIKLLESNQVLVQKYREAYKEMEKNLKDENDF